MTRRFIITIIVIVSLSLTSLPASFAMPGGNPTQKLRQAGDFKPGFNLFTLQQDVQIGSQSLQNITQQTPAINDPEIQGYIQNLGKKLASYAPGARFPYQFQVLAVREINAACLPGGFAFVNAGAIMAASNEGQLAGVMAHEISHAALRHGTNQASKALIYKLGLTILNNTAPGVQNSNLGQLISALGGYGANLLFLKFSRGAEKQADLEGSRILAEAGYDPHDMANFFDTLAASAGQRPPEILSDHPGDANRKRYILEAIPSLPMNANPMHDSREFENVKGRLLAMASVNTTNQVHRVEGNSLSSRGYKRPDRPVSSYKTYMGPNNIFKLDAPTNWDAQVLRNTETSSEYILAPKGGYGKYQNTMVVTHGVFVGSIKVQERTLRAATNAYIKRELEANPDYQITRDSVEVVFQNQRGLASVMTGTSVITGQMEVNVIYTALTSDGHLFYLITVTPEDEAGVYNPTFKRIQQSVNF